MLALSIIAVVLSFALGSMAYVYRVRGTVRYDTLSEYLRKSWPIFAPLNCLLYMFTEKRAQRPIMDLQQFPELEEIRKNWELIRREAIALYEGGNFETAKDPNSVAHHDVGFRTFYKYGWSKFYLRWYGYTHDSARRLCPETAKLLEKIPAVNGAMFSLLPVGSKLTRHADPIACSLRYHLGISTPNDDRCYINIDGTNYSWRDGEALLFDETYLHFAFNNSDRYRLILMCDVERPTNLIGTLINLVYKQLMKWTVVPNMDGDRRGLANRVMGSLAPVFARSKELKKTNRNAYRVLKYSVNGFLILALLGILAGAVSLVQSLFS